jgi:peptidoglycan hydrolase-like protein with peptidoglycan-binding domain
MSELAQEVTDEPVQVPKRGRHRSRGRWVAVTTTVVVVLAGAGVVYVERGHIWPDRPAASASGVVDNGSPTSLATVSQQDLSAQQQVNGTLGYLGSYSVLNRAQGTLTQLPAIGQVIGQGQQLYQVNGIPVDLLYGSIPQYRDLAENLTGADVAQLNAALVAAGFATTSQLNPNSDTFGAATKAAVQRLQKALGVTQDGVLHQGQVVFLPGAIRVTSIPAQLGAPAGGAVLQATSTSRVVILNLDASQQSQIKVGDQVSITLPNNQTTQGVVASVGTVATAPSGSGANGGGDPTVTVNITPTDSAATGTLDQAPVQVSITTASAPNALVVPVTSLLSLTGGGYAVEVVRPGGKHTLVAVTLGLTDDAAGLVQVTNTTLRQGDRIVVAGQ